MAAESAHKAKKQSNFRRFFLRGLAILLPTILTLWILLAVYKFVDQNIAGPLNRGVREIILLTTDWPEADPKFIRTADDKLKLPKEENQARYEQIDETQRQGWLNRRARRLTLEDQWNEISIGQWAVLDLIGLLIAIFLIYTAGAILGSIFGRKLYRRIEDFIRHLPVIKAVYPYVKQVTDFLFGSPDEQITFDRVVAVEYPRRGMWSIGLVTGDTMTSIQVYAEKPCVTVFIPSSPTPFTGYTVTVPLEDTIELSISIDEALRFTVSGGVILPDSESGQALAKPSPGETTSDTASEPK
jgi:uncharacterized membrane protein